MTGKMDEIDSAGVPGQRRRGQRHSLSGTLASMANGLPYTIAAQIAHPQRQCVGFVGDGGFTLLMGEIATAVKYELPIKIVDREEQLAKGTPNGRKIALTIASDKVKEMV